MQCMDSYKASCNRHLSTDSIALRIFRTASGYGKYFDRWIEKYAFFTCKW
jgi:hypothetical protein